MWLEGLLIIDSVPNQSLTSFDLCRGVSVDSRERFEAVQQVLQQRSRRWHEEPLTVIQSEEPSTFSAGLGNSSGSVCDSV